MASAGSTTRRPWCTRRTASASWAAGVSLTTNPSAPDCIARRRKPGPAERRHDQHPGRRRDPAYLGGGADPVEARHLDVEQRDVGPVLEHGRDDGVARRDLGDDLEVGLEAQQRRQGAAHERLVVGQQEPDRHGTTTLSEKPGLQRLGDDGAAEGGRALAEPGQPVAGAGGLRAASVVADLDLVLAEDHGAAPGAAVPDHVGDALADRPGEQLAPVGRHVVGRVRAGRRRSRPRTAPSGRGPARRGG